MNPAGETSLSERFKRDKKEKIREKSLSKTREKPVIYMVIGFICLDLKNET